MEHLSTGLSLIFGADPSERLGRQKRTAHNFGDGEYFCFLEFQCGRVGGSGARGQSWVQIFRGWKELRDAEALFADTPHVGDMGMVWSMHTLSGYGLRGCALRSLVHRVCVESGGARGAPGMRGDSREAELL